MDNTFRIAISFPENLHLKNLKDWELFESKILFDVSCRLVRYQAGKFSPELASSWQTSTNQLTHTFELNREAAFSDGRAITSEDVAFAIKRHILLKGQYWHRYAEVIKGLNRIKNIDDKIEGIDTSDKHKIIFHLNKRLDSFVRDISFLSFGIFDRRFASMTQDSISPDLTSCGPYRIEQFNSNMIVLKRNEKYWLQKNEKLFDTIQIYPFSGMPQYEGLLKGIYDYAHMLNSLTPKKDVERLGLSQIEVGPGLFMFVSDFSGPSNRVLPRLPIVLNKMIDRQILTDRITNTIGVKISPTAFVSAGIDSLKKKYSNYKPDTDSITEAKKMAKKLGTKEVTFAILDERSQHDAPDFIAAEYITQHLASLGFRTRILKLKRNQIYSNERKGIYDFALVGHLFDTESPAHGLQFLAGSDPKSNNLPSNHPIYEFYKRIPFTETYDENIELVKEFNNLHREYGFLVPLYEDVLQLLFSKKVNAQYVAPYDFNWRFSDLRRH